MSQPDNSDIDDNSGIDIVDVGFIVAVVAVGLLNRQVVGQAAVGLLDKQVVGQAAVIGLIELIAAGVLILAFTLGRRVLAPWRSRRRGRRRQAYFKRLRDTCYAQDNDNLLPMISPYSSSGQSRDPPRPFDPQAAARFWETLEFGDFYTALRAARLRECDVQAWLDAGLNWALEGDPRRDFAMQVLEFIRRRHRRRRPIMAGESHAPMLGGIAHPERRCDEMDVS